MISMEVNVLMGVWSSRLDHIKPVTETWDVSKVLNLDSLRFEWKAESVWFGTQAGNSDGHDQW